MLILCSLGILAGPDLLQSSPNLQRVVVVREMSSLLAQMHADADAKGRYAAQPKCAPALDMALVNVLYRAYLILVALVLNNNSTISFGSMWMWENTYFSALQPPLHA